jgi:3-(3-hydroxy-phenyl)propionate hydroxylase
MPRYEYQRFGYVPPPEVLSRPTPARYRVAIVGAGPTGLSIAIDLALKGVATVVLDDNDVVSIGSRAICWAKRTLEVFDRLGVGDRMVEKGVTWNIGRLFHGDREVYRFDLLPESGYKMPAFINLQQYYVEQYLVERARQFPSLIDLRFKNKAVGVEKLADGAAVTVETPDGVYRLEADYLLACDGAKSIVRSALGLEFSGKLFEERFLIADVEMKADFPSERWFWFEPTFHRGQSALLHKQPDNVYRIDLQLGPQTDPEEEKRLEKVIPRIAQVVGHREFEIDWVSIYTFQCRRLERFVHDRVIFVGDSAHIVSPFGARGGNGGIQDVDNLGWKLAAVLKGHAPENLLQSYDEERIRGADENIAHSTRATNFMTPKSPTEKMLRDEVMALAVDLEFARKLVNSGRLSTPFSLAGLSLQTPAPDALLEPGSPCKDAPLRRDGSDIWLLNLLGDRFTLLSIGDRPRIEANDIPHIHVARAGEGPLEDFSGLALERYGAGLTYLIRPDQHVAAAFRVPEAAAILAARDRALGRADLKEGRG